MSTTESSPAPARLASLDAYRGFVMLLMLAEVLRLRAVANAFPDSAFWKFLAFHQSHVEWIGCSLHDLIQPSFSFLVGVALPFSIANRAAKGQSPGRMWLHALGRALALVLLGVFLRSTGRPMIYWTFEDTLSQIGLGYGALFLLGFRPVRDQWIALGVVLVGYWAAFALWSAPADFEFAKAGVKETWLADHRLTGLAAHWNKNSNLAWAFDTGWLNIFPREKPFEFNNGGYATLSFIPTLGTMILGLLAGGVLRGKRAPMAKVKWFVIAGMASLATGWLVGALGICPVVKRIWTPSWVLFSGGLCCLFLASFYAVVDVWQRKAWAFPLVVIGTNSIAAYCMDHLFGGFIKAMLKTVCGQNAFKFLGASYEPVVHGAATLLVFWLLLFWLYRRKIFLRI